MIEIEMYKSGNSIKQISVALSIPLSTLRYKLKKAGVLRSREEAIKIAAKHGRLGGGLRGKKRIFSDDWKKKISEGRKKWAKKNAKGFSLKQSGYIEITRGKNKGRLEHVMLMEKKIGRRLKRNECVHHINEKRSDNRLENLQLMTVSEHIRLHALKNNYKRKREKNGRYS